MDNQLKKELLELCKQFKFSMREPDVTYLELASFKAVVMVDVDSVRVFTTTAVEETVESAVNSAIEKMIARTKDEIAKEAARSEIREETNCIRALTQATSKSGLKPRFVTCKTEGGYKSRCCCLSHGTAYETAGKTMPTEIEAENEAAKLLLGRIKHAN